MLSLHNSSLNTQAQRVPRQVRHLKVVAEAKRVVKQAKEKEKEKEGPR